MSFEDSGAGFEHVAHFRIMYQSSEVHPVRNIWSRDFSPAVYESFKTPTPSRGIAVLGISNGANSSFVLTEPRTRDYASECNELTVPEDSSLMGLGLNSSAVKKVPERKGENVLK